MQKFNIGFLIVRDDENIIGVISERDIVYKSVKDNGDLLSTNVATIMTAEIIWGEMEDDLKVCLGKMKTGNFRHLPVRTEDGHYKAVRR